MQVDVKAVRRLPVGADIQPQGGVHFRVWAPARKAVEVVTGDGQRVALEPEGGGYFGGVAVDARAGTLYKYRLDRGETFPDPASRYQPQGPHGPSQVVDPEALAWTDQEWRGFSIEGQVLYEMHVGTFTTEGTWASAMLQLPPLADLGVTVLEVMPVAEFPGRFGWGYDGVGLFAPTRLYGEPDDFRRFVDRAHGLGLAVILDVVYNHLGPDGNYLAQFSPDYFSKRYKNEWGDPINFDGPNSGPVREFFMTNASYWIDEFHLDGLRLDATQQIYDSSEEHFVAAVQRRVREAANGRATIVIAENEPGDSRLVRPLRSGGYGLDALWNDDLHHSAIAALTGRNEAYYSDYGGKPQELLSAAKYGFLYQGQYYSWQQKLRGTPSLDVPPAAVVTFLENHDQVANSGYGRRLHQLTTPGRFRAMTAFLLLSPGTPMLFQGQEYGSSRPFVYFADHKSELAEKIREGRIEFLRQFPSLACPEMRSALADPASPENYERCKLDHGERKRDGAFYRLHQDLIRLRRSHSAFTQWTTRGSVDGAVIGPEAFLLRFFGSGSPDEHRLLLVNLGMDLSLESTPEPLIAPPAGRRWKALWSSEDPRYGGCGTPAAGREGVMRLPGHSALVLEPAHLDPIWETERREEVRQHG